MGFSWVTWGLGFLYFWGTKRSYPMVYDGLPWSQSFGDWEGCRWWWSHLYPLHVRALCLIHTAVECVCEMRMLCQLCPVWWVQSVLLWVMYARYNICLHITCGCIAFAIELLLVKLPLHYTITKRAGELHYRSLFPYTDYFFCKCIAQGSYTISSERKPHCIQW